MSLLILGLLLFLGTHSVRVVADGWRTQVIKRRGERLWKLGYTLLSVTGFVLIVWGYSRARLEPVPLWTPQVWARHLASLLTLVAFVLVVAAYVPRNHLKARLKHPMLLGVKAWALAHLLANHTVADLLLFGGFLAWAVVCYVSAKRRDERAGRLPPPGTAIGTALAIVIGLVAWGVFGQWVHGAWLGVRPWP